MTSTKGTRNDEIQKHINNKDKITEYIENIKNIEDYHIKNIIFLYDIKYDVNIKKLFDVKYMFDVCIDAVAKNNYEFLNKIFKIASHNKLFINLNKTTKNNETLLSWACYKGSIDCIELLFDYAVTMNFQLNIHVKEYGKRLTLDWIFYESRVDILKLFIKYNKTLNINIEEMTKIISNKAIIKNSVMYDNLLNDILSYITLFLMIALLDIV